MGLFSETKTKMVPLTLDSPPSPCLLCCCQGEPKVVTRVTVISASGLPKQDLIGQADPYVLVKAEGQALSSETVKNCLEPEWNFSIIFYRRHPEKPIKIQVWNSSLMVDKFMGQTVVDSKESGDPDNPFGEEAARHP